MLDRGTLRLHYQVGMSGAPGWVDRPMQGQESVGRTGPGIPTLLLNKHMVAGGRGCCCGTSAACARSLFGRRARAATAAAAHVQRVMSRPAVKAQTLSGAGSLGQTSYMSDSSGGSRVRRSTIQPSR